MKRIAVLVLLSLCSLAMRPVDESEAVKVARAPVVPPIPLYFFSPEAEYLLSSSQDLLAVCSPPLYRYVRANVRAIYASYETSEEWWSGSVNIEERLLWSVAPPVQPILVMHILVHESRHIEVHGVWLGIGDEADANQFFPVIVSDCAAGLDLSPIYRVTNPSQSVQ